MRATCVQSATIGATLITVNFTRDETFVLYIFFNMAKGQTFYRMTIDEMISFVEPLQE